MPRRLRIQYPGAIYHVMARGNARQNIVRDDPDRDHLQELLGRAAVRRGWRVYAFVLMSNHLHVVLKTPQPNLPCLTRTRDFDTAFDESMRALIDRATRKNLKLGPPPMQLLGSESAMAHRLNDSLTPGQFVRVTRPFPGEPEHDGVIIGVGESLLMLLQFHDFYPEGYGVLRIDDILEVHCGKSESFWADILTREGIIGQVETPCNTPLDDIRSFLGTRLGQHIILECESPEDEADDDFYIGKLLSLGEDSASLKTFNALGVWDDDVSVVSYSAITQMQIESPYINIITKYLSERAN